MTIGSTLTVTMNPALDMTTGVEALIPREKLRANEPTFEPGGGGINVSRMMKVLGGSSLPFLVSGGHTGAMLCTQLNDLGFEPHAYPISGATRQSVVVFERSKKTQYRFVMPGPHLTEAEWQGALDEIARLAQGRHYVVASGSLPPGIPADFFARVADVTAKAGAKLVLDTSGAALEAAIGAPLHILKLDEEEMRDLMDGSTASEDREEAGALDLLERTGAQIIVVTLGKRGALVVTPDGFERIRSPKVEVVSTVGAGDSFVAGLTKALCDGWSVFDASRYGVATGAAAVLTPGTELARAEDVARLYDVIKAEPGQAKRSDEWR